MTNIEKINTLALGYCYNPAEVAEFRGMVVGLVKELMEEARKKGISKTLLTLED